MKKTLICLAIVLVILGSTMVLAQETIIEKVFLELRPEYDREDLLVVYTILLKDNQNFPINLSVKIPTSSGGPSAVWEVVDGQPVETTYETSESGNWISVDIQTNSPMVYLDYYDTDFYVLEFQHNFNFNYPPGLYAEEVELMIWQPPFSENFQASVVFDEILTDDNGNLFHVITFDSDQLDDLNIEFSYDAVIAEISDDDSEFFWMDALPYVIGLIGLSVLVYGIYKLNFKNQNKSKLKKKRNRSKSNSTSKTKFCHKCGNQMKTSDSFCSECGEKNR